MKKYLALLLAVLLMAAMFAGCSKPAADPAAPADPATPAEPTAEGQVYYLNFKPEQDEDWQALAAAYTAETGVPVKVVTAASNTYETTLTAEMGKEGAPTMFQVNGPVGLNLWKDYCYDLTGSKVLGELTSDGFALKDGEATAAIAYVVESYGLITNKTLLAEAGYKPEDIKDYASFKAIVEDITARKAELGFSAFTSAGMDGSSDWRFKTHLANLPIYYEYEAEGMTPGEIKGTYLDNYRNIWDLYINNSTCEGKDLTGKTGDDSRNEFINKEAVFFQNGSWEYGNLVGEGLAFTDDDLAMLPIYIGVEGEENQGLCTGTENYWCVNKEAAPEDIQATLDFLYWVVTSEEGTTSMANDMNFVIPFKSALESTNLFVKQDAEMTAAGKTPVAWSFSTMPSENWKAGLSSALAAYAADQTDEKWDAVKAAFVDNWKTEYELAQAA